MACHNGFGDKGSARSEYTTWVMHDQHAKAYEVLFSDRSQRMAKSLGIGSAEKADLCLNCHAMHIPSSQRPPNYLSLVSDGVSCESCHGPAEKWLDKHYRPEWKGKRDALGMWRTDDLTTRAKICADCHVGSPGRDVNHAMFAAGHPPLPPIDIATFSRNQPQHWRDSKDVPLFQNPRNEEIKKNFHLVKQYDHLESAECHPTKLALIGSVVALRATMKLARDRADFKAEAPAQLWPELLLGLDKETAKEPSKLRALARQRWPEIAMAHSDCYSCHHDLKYPGYRQERNFGYRLSWSGLFRVTPGRPLLRTWPAALLEAGVGYTGSKEREKTLEASFKQLAKACDRRPFGHPEEVTDAAQTMLTWCDRAITDLKKAPYNKESIRKLILDVARLASSHPDADHPKGTPPLLPDYESARQIVSLLDVAYEDWRGKGPEDPEVRKILKTLAVQVNLMPYVRRSERLKLILGVVGKATKEKNLEGMKEFSDYLSNVGDNQRLTDLIKNRFLIAIQTQLSNEAFTKELLEPAVIKELQRFSNEELRLTLECIAEYDPRMFKENLRKLVALMEGRK